MKSIAIISTIILSIIFAEAQEINQFKIDSIKHEITIAKEDTNTVNMLLMLSNLYSDARADTAIVYAQ